MIEIQLFPTVTDRTVHSVQSLDRLLTWSQTNEILKRNTNQYRKFLADNPFATKEQKSKAKVFYFPACTFSGTFTGTGKAQDIKNMSGLIVLDFDHIQKLIEIRQKLENDAHTFLLFSSPSNDGLKVIVKHDLSDPLKWQYLYYELEKYYLNLFNGYQCTDGSQLCTDPSGKDINRMCFLPFMNTLFKKDTSTIWQYQGTFEKSKVAKLTHTTLANDTTDDLYKESFYIAAYLFEYKICMTEQYEDWLLYGYSLCELGESGREIFHNISCLSEKYDPDTLDTKYDYMLGHYDPEKNGIETFISNGKRAIAHHQLMLKYGFQCQ